MLWKYRHPPGRAVYVTERIMWISVACSGMWYTSLPLCSWRVFMTCGTLGWLHSIHVFRAAQCALRTSAGCGAHSDLLFWALTWCSLVCANVPKWRRQVCAKRRWPVARQYVVMTPSTAMLTFICGCTSKFRKFVCLGFRIFAITQTRATVSTFRYWFRRIVLRPSGWQSASPTLVLLCRPLPAQSSAVLAYLK